MADLIPNPNPNPDPNPSQVTLALRLLAYVSLFRVLGPLLVTVLAMVSDAARFSGVLLVVIVGWANGVCVCVLLYIDAYLVCVCI